MSHIVTAYVYSHAREKTDLAFCTSYGDETSANREQPNKKEKKKLEAEKAWERSY